MTLIQTFGQGGQIIIGKGYSARQDSTSDKVYISIRNDLGFTIKDVKLTYDKQPLLAIQKLASGRKKCYSFLKNELKGNNIFILQFGTLTDTLRGTDDISYNIHYLELSNPQKPLTTNEKRNTAPNDTKKEDEYFTPTKCSYRQQKL